MVLLFDNNVEIQRFTSHLSDEIRQQPSFAPSMQHAFLIARNMVKVRDTTIYLGLKKDESMLSSRYGEDEIAYYGE